jgi:hypothetical protein
VPVEPGPVVGAEEGDDRDEADGVEQERDAPPEKVGAAIASVEEEKEEGQPERDGPLEQGSREFRGGEDVHDRR